MWTVRRSWPSRSHRRSYLFCLKDPRVGLQKGLYITTAQLCFHCMSHRSERRDGKLAAGLPTRASRSYLFSQAETDRQRLWDGEEEGEWGRQILREGDTAEKARDTEVWEGDRQEGSAQIEKVNHSYAWEGKQSGRVRLMRCRNEDLNKGSIEE